MNHNSQEATVTILFNNVEYVITGTYDPGDQSEQTYGVGGKQPAFYIDTINIPSEQGAELMIEMHGNEIADLCIAKLHERR